MPSMSKIETIPDVINLWPRRADLAADLSGICADRSVSVAQVHKWAASESIPARFHFSLIQAAAQRGYPVTADLLAQAHHFVRRGAA